VNWRQRVRCGTVFELDTADASLHNVQRCGTVAEAGSMPIRKAGPMWNGSFTKYNSCRAAGIRTGYRGRKPSQRTVALQSKIAVVAMCGSWDVCNFKLCNFAMTTQYPYSALAQNYIVETAITRPPPVRHVVHSRLFPIGRSNMLTAFLLAAHYSALTCYWRLIFATTRLSPTHTVQPSAHSSMHRVDVTILWSLSTYEADVTSCRGALVR